MKKFAIQEHDLMMESILNPPKIPTGATTTGSRQRVIARLLEMSQRTGIQPMSYRVPTGGAIPLETVTAEAPAGTTDQPGQGTYTYTPPTEEQISIMALENEYAAQTVNELNQATQSIYDEAIAQGLSPMQAQEARRTSPAYKELLESVFAQRRLARIGGQPYHPETMKLDYLQQVLTTPGKPREAEAAMGVSGAVSPQFSQMTSDVINKIRQTRKKYGLT